MSDNQTFTCIGRGHGAPAMPATRQEWEALRREPWLAQMCSRIEAGEEKLKHQLPIWTPHCAEFKNNHRANADALRPLPRLMLDFDQKGHSAEILARALELDRAGQWQVLLVEESVRRGTHVLIGLPRGMSAQEAQERFSAAVGFQADGAVKDVCRCIYMVPEGHTLYVNEERIFTIENSEMFTDSSVPTPEEEAKGQQAATADANLPTSFKGLAYEGIIDQWFKLAGGEPVAGERNDKLHRLAAHLRYICDNNEELLFRLMPRYGLAEEEMRGLIRSACSARFGYMPRLMKKAIELEEQRQQEESAGTGKAGENMLPPEPPRMPDKLPPLIKLLVSRTPEIYRPAVAHAVFPALAAHLWHTTFRYIDNVEHEATLMNVLMAGTGAGKNCIGEPINRIMADIRRRDEENRQREQAWKEEMQTRGANKDKRKRPEGLVIQEIDPDMTNAAFVMRLSEAEDRFLYARLNEIDQFDALKTSARSKAQFQIMCLAFDPGNTYGQTRVGTSSVSARVCIRFNWNASTTIQKGKEYFRRVLTDGPVSRINFCTIPERPIGSEMPVYGTYDADFDDQLRPYIDRLNAARGLIVCPQAERLARRLMEENADFARLSQNRTYENLSFRANVIAYLKAMVLYVAQGQKWSRTLEEFIRWSERYDLWCKIRFFGAEIEEMENETSRPKMPGPKNLLDLLPNVFSRDEAEAVRRKQKICQGSPVQMLSNWKKRGYIRQCEDRPEYYEKTQSYLEKHG